MTTQEIEREEMERDALIVTALTARTPEQCSHAEGLIIAWMQTHPRDFGILDAGSQLAMMSDRFDRPAGEAQTSPVA